ncbi:MAG: hypothetical protein HQL24_09015 [Candidatus Omnitrophica bacterium]|nr:hypothetical protein [Candidatus Omnitrophota bacterium]
MKISKILIIVIVLMVFAENNFSMGESTICGYPGENVRYLIRPFGKSEYNDFGVVSLKGVPVHLVIFRTKILFLDDTEKIYSDPESFLPYKIERRVSRLWAKEFITEEYDQKDFTIITRKFKGKKLVNEQVVKANGPIQNVILLSLYLRRCPNFQIGWYFNVRLPDEFKVELVSIDEVAVPAGKFKTYHFKSIPDKFEIWFNKDDPRVPIKIQGKGILNYALLMKKYTLPGH